MVQFILYKENAKKLLILAKITKREGGRLTVMQIIYTKAAPKAIGPYS